MLAGRILAFVLPAAFVLIPLSVAPGWMFYFDVTPKVAALLAVTAVALPCAPAVWPGLRAAWRDPASRLFLAGLGVLAASAVVSTLASERPALSFGGGNWRAMGLFVRLALAAFAALLLGWLWGRADRRDWVFRVSAWTAVPISLYAVLQYFGVEPLLPPLYYAGPEETAVVRPPATLGHAGYLGVYLTVVVFWAAGRASASSRAIAALATVAILFSGSRGAVVGLAAGALIWAWRRRPRFSWRFAGVAAAVVAAVALFLLSPAGSRMRSRVVWSIEDFHGGSRPWLWRDALAMGAARPWFGHGLETFSASYPRYKSAALARLYPDQYQESAHNPLLGAWAEQGAVGVGGWMLVFAAGLWGVVRRREVSNDHAAAAVAASAVAAQFLSWTTPTAFFFLAAVAALPAGKDERPPAGTAPRPLGSLAALPLSAAFAWFAASLIAAETRAQQAREHFSLGCIGPAVEAFRATRHTQPPGRSLDFWFSRRLAGALDAAAIADPELWKEVARAAERAAAESDNPANAYLSLAEIRARAEDPESVIDSLRRSVDAAPTWYAPRVRLAQVLTYLGRIDAAREEARTAVELAGPKADGVRRELARLLEAPASGQAGPQPGLDQAQ